jgi:phosphoribosylformylglycinamidine cyclo-ligase
LGGETAEHGGVMKLDDLDVAGFAVGVVERGEELGASRVREGDALIGFGSPGLRSNGYTLARRILIADGADLSEPAFAGSSRTLAEELLTPSVIYAPTVTTLREELGGAIHAVAHVTGGGIMGNVIRLLPENFDAVIDMTSFETPEIFFEIQRRGQVSSDEMVRVFNCGLGMVVALDASGAEAAITLARAAGLTSSVVGEIRSGSAKVILT